MVGTAGPTTQTHSTQPNPETLTRPDGAVIHFERWGRWPSGPNVPTVLFISPGSTPISSLRQSLEASSSSLLTSFCCIAFDCRGIGKSSMPSESWLPPSTRVHAEDACAILDAVGWSAASVIGISFGGIVAQELCLLHPQVVKRLLLVCTGNDSPSVVDKGPFRLMSLLDKSSLERSQAVLLLADTRRTQNWLSEPEGATLVSILESADAVADDDPSVSEGRAYQYKSRDNSRTYERLRAVTHFPPTAVFACVFDGMCPPRSSQSLRDSIPGASLVWFNAGHWPGIVREMPHQFDAAAAAFLRMGLVPPSVMLDSARVETSIEWERTAAYPSKVCSLASCYIL